ncbi:MAG TPA: hypothetical protein VIU15_27775 [Streptomyces sp.]
MVDLATAIKKGAQVDAYHNYGRAVVIPLPGSGDQVSIYPGPQSSPASPPQLLWQRNNSSDVTVGGGKLPWPSDPQPIVDWVISMAYATDEIGPQYAPVLAALREHGLIAHIIAVKGVGHLIRVPLPDSTFLTIGGDKGLPARVDQVEDWHVQHHGVTQHIGVAYHGCDLHRMIVATRQYLHTTATRYGSHHPLGAPVDGERGDGPDKLYGLLSDLSELRRTTDREQGGALLIVADADGHNGATIDVPAEVVTRLCRLITVEMQVIETYGG